MFRIGEFSRRTGVAPELLRAWERRYGLFEPTRTPGGFRLYGDEEIGRVRRMKALIAEGLSPGEAARLSQAGPADGGAAGASLESWRGRLGEALERFDGEGAERVLDDLLASFDQDTVLREVLLPYLHDLGESWRRGEVSVAQEHFASRLIEGRLLALGRGWDRGSGPLALVACPPGEEHVLGAICFALALHRRGWRIAYLGADTPMDSLSEAQKRLQPALTVMSATNARRFTRVEPALRKLKNLALGGAGAKPELVRRAGARLLEGDPVTAADAVAAT